MLNLELLWFVVYIVSLISFFNFNNVYELFTSLCITVFIWSLNPLSKEINWAFSQSENSLSQIIDTLVCLNSSMKFNLLNSNLPFHQPHLISMFKDSFRCVLFMHHFCFHCYSILSFLVVCTTYSTIVVGRLLLFFLSKCVIFYVHVVTWYVSIILLIRDNTFTVTMFYTVFTLT